MKHLQRVLTLALIIAMMMSFSVIPASAATINSIDWGTEFRSFPQLYNGSTESGYIKMLQRFLLVYPLTYSSIYNAGSSYGGVDGGFGNDTETAVKLFQYNVLGAGNNDGYVGKNTWSAIYSLLQLNSSGIFEYNGIGGPPVSGINSKVIQCIEHTGYGRVLLDTFNHQNARFYSYFRTIY